MKRYNIKERKTNGNQLMQSVNGYIPINRIMPGDKLYGMNNNIGIVARVSIDSDSTGYMFTLKDKTSFIVNNEHTLSMISSYCYTNAYDWASNVFSIKGGPYHLNYNNINTIPPMELVGAFITYGDNTIEELNISIYTNFNIGYITRVLGCNEILANEKMYQFVYDDGRILTWRDLLHNFNDCVSMSKWKYSNYFPYMLTHSSIPLRKKILNGIFTAGMNFSLTNLPPLQINIPNIEIAIEIRNLIYSVGLDCCIMNDDNSITLTVLNAGSLYPEYYNEIKYDYFPKKIESCACVDNIDIYNIHVNSPDIIAVDINYNPIPTIFSKFNI